MTALENMREALGRSDGKAALSFVSRLFAEELDRAETKLQKIVTLIHERREMIGSTGETGMVTECSQHIVTEYGSLLAGVQEILEQ